MARLDLDVIRHALERASEMGFAEVELALGEDRFEASFQSRASSRKPIKGAGPAEPQELPERVVTAPSVGYFRHRPEPLEVGQTVQEGESLGDILALGLRNEVSAKWNGTVTDVLVADDEAVEYGQKLMILKVGS